MSFILHPKLTPVIGISYEILSDPESREAYDRGGLEGLKGGTGLDDLFSQFFSFGFDFTSTRKRTKGQDSLIPYDVTLEDLYNGKIVKMNMEKEVVCSTCNGYAISSFVIYILTNFSRSGARGNAKPKRCSKCEGNGWSYGNTPVSWGYFSSHYGCARACRFLPIESVSPEFLALNATAKVKSSRTKKSGAFLQDVPQ